MKRTSVFLITGFLGVFMIGISLSMLFVKNTFGFNIFSSSERACIPYNIFVEKGRDDYSVVIKWNTKKDCVGFVQYGEQRDYLNLVAIDQVNRVKSKTHEVAIEKLLTTQRYYFLVNSEDVSYGYNGKALDFSLQNL